MGVTLHYKGRLKSPSLIPAITNEVEDIVSAKGWEYTLISEKKEDLEEDDLLLLNGIMIAPPNCEPLSLTFMPDGKLISPLISMFPKERIKEFLVDEEHYSFTKTQHGGVDVHIEIVNLLKYLSDKYFSDWACLDDTTYYESGDKEKLEETIAIIDRAMDALDDALDIHGDKLDTTNPEAMADFVKSVLGAEDVEIKLINTPLGEHQDIADNESEDDEYTDIQFDDDDDDFDFDLDELLGEE